MIHSPCRRRVRNWAAASVLTVVLTGCGPSGADTQDTEASDSEIATTHHVIDTGDAAVAPAFVDDQWQLVLHDAVSSEDGLNGTWRSPDDTVIKAGTEAVFEVPESDTYDFLDAEPGDEIWALRSAEETDAPTVGVSTQATEALDSIDQGVTVSLTGVQGPGTVSAYTRHQFSGHIVGIWDSLQPYPQPHWVDTGDLSDVNWIFTEPGTYLVELTARAQLIEGSEFFAPQIFRFSIGSEADTESVLTTAWLGPRAEPYFQPGAVAQREAQGPDSIAWILLAAIVVLAMLVLVGAVQLITRRRRAGQNKEMSDIDDEVICP